MKNIILFGFKGVGKTYYGKLLSEKLQRPFIDIDRLIETRYFEKSGEKWSVSQIYKEEGEKFFRQLEKEAVFSLERVDGAVISLGGGTILDPENAAFLQEKGILIYLKAPISLIQSRLFKGPPPAFLEGKDAKMTFLHMIKAREPLYESILAEKIDLSKGDEAGVIASFHAILKAHGI